MDKRNLAITLKEAREWYNSGDKFKKELSLKAFSKEELEEFNFHNILTFRDVWEYFNFGKDCQYIEPEYTKDFIQNSPKELIPILKLRLIREVLNTGESMSLTKKTIWYPYYRLVKESCNLYGNELRTGVLSVVGKLKYEGEFYKLLGGDAFPGANAGLGAFGSGAGVGYSIADVGFLGCASKEIARHFGAYFAKEIFEAMYSGFINYKWID